MVETHGPLAGEQYAPWASGFMIRGIRSDARGAADLMRRWLGSVPAARTRAVPHRPRFADLEARTIDVFTFPSDCW
jgi:hypothetical protein